MCCEDLDLQTNTTAALPPDFAVNPIGYLQYYLAGGWVYVFLILQLVILLIVYIIVVRLIRRTLKRVGMGTEAVTGITLVARLVFFVFAIMLTVGTFEANLATILSITALFGTAIGIAFSQAISNIVSGFYVLIARPFRVGDYVRVGSVEGIVREITLNYTRILLPDETRQYVPNSKVVTSEVTNFRITVSDYIKEQEEIADEEDTDKNYRKAVKDALKQLGKITRSNEAFRYTFDLTYHMSYSHGELRKRFDTVCDKWASVFVTRPEYQVWAVPNAGLTYRFAIIVEDPMMIIKRVSDFMKDLTEILDNA